MYSSVSISFHIYSKLLLKHLSSPSPYGLKVSIYLYSTFLECTLPSGEYICIILTSPQFPHFCFLSSLFQLSGEIFLFFKCHLLMKPIQTPTLKKMLPPFHLYPKA